MTDGLRGHVFADATNDTVVIAIKGTSISLTGFPEGPTGSVERDRMNDNLLFSCCCGTWNLFVGPACKCATAKETCNSTCMTESLQRPDTYYTLAKELYWNVTELYPTANIWLTGHSLGGSIAALLGATVFVPAVTFEAPGEAMAARRLGLPTPPEYHLGVASDEISFSKGAYHFGHTADPIFLGACSGLPCSFEGFFLQSVCHSGSVCIWDAQKDLGWSRSVINHRIITIVDNLLPKYNVTPECKVSQNCTDCPNWKFDESHQSKPATSTTTSVTTTTVICTSPGWWGCLEPTTTSHTTTKSTSTCMTPGWFGCKDRTTSLSSTTTADSIFPSKTLGECIKHSLDQDQDWNYYYWARELEDEECRNNTIEKQMNRRDDRRGFDSNSPTLEHTRRVESFRMRAATKDGLEQELEAQQVNEEVGDLQDDAVAVNINVDVKGDSKHPNVVFER